jgi:hypothetical protein
MTETNTQKKFITIRYSSKEDRQRKEGKGEEALQLGWPRTIKNRKRSREAGREEAKKLLRDRDNDDESDQKRPFLMNSWTEREKDQSRER